MEELITVEIEQPTELETAFELGGGIIPTGTKQISITSNGTTTEDVANYADAEITVNVQGGITPTGTKQISITSNGTITEDVTNYADAEITVNVPAPGGYTLEQFGECDISGDIVYASSKIKSLMFQQTKITSFIGDNVTGFSNDAVGGERAVFRGCNQLVTVSMALYNQTTNAESMFWGCSALANINLPSLSRIVPHTFRYCTSLQRVKFQSVSVLNQYCFQGCTSLKAIDFTSQVRIAGGKAFDNCQSLDTVVLRNNRLCVLDTVNNFDGTKFASGASGGTVYVPSALISSYQTATNWSTLYNGGTCTFVAIEGSQYENYYVDGTPIS